MKTGIFNKMSMQRFKGRNIVVTGAARGIGKGIAKRFLNEGGSILLVDNNKENLKKTEQEFKSLVGLLSGHNQEVYSYFCDVSVKKEVDGLIKYTYSNFESVHVVVSNAGIAQEKPLLEIDYNEWRKVLSNNLDSMFLICQGFAKRMKEDPKIKEYGGSIILMGSKVGNVCEPGYTHYCTSKGGIRTLTQSLATELAPNNITVNCVAPGYIVTPMSQEIDSPKFVNRFVKNLIPAARPGTIDDVVGVFAFLASSDARFINGVTIPIDGGQTAFSGFLDYQDKA